MYFLLNSIIIIKRIHTHTIIYLHPQFQPIYLQNIVQFKFLIHYSTIINSNGVETNKKKFKRVIHAQTVTHTYTTLHPFHNHLAACCHPFCIIFYFIFLLQIKIKTNRPRPVVYIHIDTVMFCDGISVKLKLKLQKKNYIYLSILKIARKSSET